MIKVVNKVFSFKVLSGLDMPSHQRTDTQSSWLENFFIAGFSMLLAALAQSIHSIPPTGSKSYVGRAARFSWW